MPQKDQTEQPDLQKTIDDILVEMKSVNANSEEYAQMADQLVKLYKLKEVDSHKRVSRDTLITVGAHILGIVLITRYEREHVLTSKALQFFRDFGR